MGQWWRRRQLLLFCFLLLALRSCSGKQKKKEEEEEEHLPSKCEVCKILSLELQGELNRSSRSRELLELGQVLDTGKRKRQVPYSTSEVRLEEALENLCEQILDYSVHAEHKGSLRYAKGQSETMATLKGLVQKGVKVDLGIPLELWDEPSVEVAFLKKQCELMLESFEDVIEDWYFHHQELPLQQFLCEGHVLGKEEMDCLQETWTEESREQNEKGLEESLGHHAHDAADL
ncbi:protein canopy homolog 4 [Phascolarctos cinereus]|uniref:Protein canopy homolog 4 n=1 Tax=Phascolarctos cinereus TaxID=38626 RepID=A0A6P5JTW6_PHACI|nr:protein canopy homolog 4 [Phascolarctos cinereus]